MKLEAKMLLGLGLLAVAPFGFAQTYNMDLTGVGNGVVADGVYVSPYQGTVTGNGLNYTGYLICDDFNTESYLNSPWTATMSSAGALDGTEKFVGNSFMFDGTSYTAQQAYNAAGWLANQLLANVGSPAQTNYAFAIWDIFDGQPTDPMGGAAALEQQAFTQAAGGYVASNVSVLTPNPLNASQEFLMVKPAPEIDAGTSTAALTLLIGGVLVVSRRRRLQA